jgi:acylphosphatase
VTAQGPNEGTTRSVRALIRGTVQGVGFRCATYDQATALGARGYVRNLADSSVEAVFEGDEATVERALAFVREGPPMASVTGVAVEPISYRGFSGFEIL